MIIVRGTPPNFKDIVAVFPAAAREGVVFTWGDMVFVNGDPEIPPQLKAHESVHQQQQARCRGPEHWWGMYLKDSTFRLEQELVAHRAEYRTLKVLNRAAAARSLNFIAERLASPLYGSMIPAKEARRLIRL